MSRTPTGVRKTRISSPMRAQPSTADPQRLESHWRQLLEALEQARTVLLLAHVSPDADALGSTLAVADVLDRRGVQVAVSFGSEPFVVPDGLRWLPGQEFVRAPSDVGTPPDVALAIDCSSLDRLGTLAPVAQAAGTFAAIDHHASYDDFAPVSVVDASEPAAGVLTAGLIDRLGADWSTSAATCIYAAISSDTGSFRFPSTNAHTLALGARLIDLGADPGLIAGNLFADKSLAVLRLTGVALVNAEHSPAALEGRGALIAIIDRDLRERFGVSYDAAESIVGELATTSDVEVAAVVKQDDAGLWKVSTRSRGGFNVGRMCTALGGGGHVAAAGYTSRVDLDSTLRGLHRALGVVEAPRS